MGGVDGCGKFLKYSMFMFNFVILISGCGLVGFGIYTRTNQLGITSVSSVLGANLVDTLSLILIIVGSIVVLLSFLGCCGAIKEVRCMLVTFFGLLLFMLVGFIVCGILIYAFRGKIEKMTLSRLKESLLTGYGKDNDVTKAWDSMQHIVNHPMPGGIQYIPESCCKDPENTPNKTKCVGQTVDMLAPKFGPPVRPNSFNDQMYTHGCYTVVEKFFSSNIKILSGLIAVITFLMILGMVFSICLQKRIKDEYYCDDDE
ncbi:hypothetical protein KUTeg_020075 [Tegillarca granosa]|uniref:Tetraspanin n=1 Tax=Tegillarca granosa TaxID=220873 RepID=A0ABQ9E6P4_TEGGR|nr:hypothetical protein KUTeg_020075 [Tegillarca granosa]